MAEIYERKGRRQLEKLVALLPVVQDALDEARFEVAARAEALLLLHRQEGHASIDVEDGEVDKYVVLDDERGKKAALSIEYGRAESVVVKERKDGTTYLDVIPASDGLFILARAANLPKKRKGKVHLD
ncbi:DUF5403 family protein [Streptomyces viridochromogenes]|uniref:DUF5403 family protein n=1 Tax=Streptomyces viridochromogenes TaxID=1938 RepID=UPI00069FD0E6|nr:DUF5403 family protein [Streptomyces viridochromogenes]KOG26818.1 hypothetical protein ADK36_02340 [Streptomyces viridochromogenes]